jgi:pimeloyl-ACP methyl ester carboxylesterase
VALIQQLGFSTIVGHDWDGAIGYPMALHHPDLIHRLVIIAASHHGTFDRELHYNQEQNLAGPLAFFKATGSSDAASG